MLTQEFISKMLHMSIFCHFSKSAFSERAWPCLLTPSPFLPWHNGSAIVGIVRKGPSSFSAPQPCDVFPAESTLSGSLPLFPSHTQSLDRPRAWVPLWGHPSLAWLRSRKPMLRSPSPGKMAGAEGSHCSKALGQASILKVFPWLRGCIIDASGSSQAAWRILAPAPPCRP